MCWFVSLCRARCTFAWISHLSHASFLHRYQWNKCLSTVLWWPLTAHYWTAQSSAYRSISSVHKNICTVDEYYGLDTCCWSQWWRSPSRHYRPEAHVDASAILVVFSVFLFVGRYSIPKLSALRIHYRLHPVGSNRDTSDSNPPDNPHGNCLSMFRFSIVAVLCWYPWLGSSRMGLSGSY
jgi:hypothetical protein